MMSVDDFRTAAANPLTTLWDLKGVFYSQYSTIDISVRVRLSDFRPTIQVAEDYLRIPTTVMDDSLHLDWTRRRRKFIRDLNSYHEEQREFKEREKRQDIIHNQLIALMEATQSTDIGAVQEEFRKSRQKRLDSLTSQRPRFRYVLPASEVRLLIDQARAATRFVPYNAKGDGS
jgi:hypothetical protein